MTFYETVKPKYSESSWFFEPPIVLEFSLLLVYGYCQGGLIRNPWIRGREAKV